jgi:glucose-1-phosphate thymidylyltransferase
LGLSQEGAVKAILLAGGSGSRLYPLTGAVSKQLLPVYDKPVIYYPLATLMLAGLRDILVISTPRDTPRLADFLGDGGRLGLRLSYRVQPRPGGIAQAFPLTADFVGREPACLILGDNIFFGHDLTPLLAEAARLREGARVFAYQVRDPGRFGVVEFDGAGRAVCLEEKPARPRSNWAVTGLYFYDGRAVELAKRLRPSARGELEITDLNRAYLEEGQLTVTPLGRGVAWLDVGTPDALLVASLFVQTLEQRQGLKVACLEEVALAKGLIGPEQFERLAEAHETGEYGQYLRRVLEEYRSRGGTGVALPRGCGAEDAASPG